jgi:RNA polymerase sigma-70 factor (ECF subfamily)
MSEIEEPASEARRALERAARDSYGRLLALLATRSRDLSAAEDALGDALRIALETWPHEGTPASPEAWLLTAARRRMIDDARRRRVREEAAPAMLAIADEMQKEASAGSSFPDERLKLLFVCAHPAIDAAARTPLMLQIVLGLDAARIASAFLVRPTAMGQRLSRAKAKIRDAGIELELPSADAVPERLEAVMNAIYAAYGSGWDDVTGADPRRKGLALEAVDLGRLLVRLVPDEAEPRGLLALMLHCEARRAARRRADGAYVPLEEQDVSLWYDPMIEEAEQQLVIAAQTGAIGRFQLEGAIQSAHAGRKQGGRTDWEAVALLYEGVVRIAPTQGALVGRAAAIAEARGAAAGLALLQSIPPEGAASYQPYWALAAHLFASLGRLDEAKDAYQTAIGLCEDPAVRVFLAARAAHVDGEPL